MIRRPPRSTLSSSSAASDVYKRQIRGPGGHHRPGAGRHRRRGGPRGRSRPRPRDRGGGGPGPGRGRGGPGWQGSRGHPDGGGAAPAVRRPGRGTTSARRPIRRWGPMISLMTSGGIALWVAVLSTPLLIRWLVKNNIGQQIREDGPQVHIAKAGTPTMGGIAI